jgi:GDSL-like Lipase/Acylhydrolase family
MMKFLLLLVALLLIPNDDPLATYRKAATEWEDDIAKLETLDKAEKDPDHSILFIGSSSIRLWENLQADIAPWPAVRRGYGGAKFSDLAIYCGRLMKAHEYRALVVFVTNDIKGDEQDKSPEEIVRLFSIVVAESKRHRPEAPIFLLAITPTRARWKAWPQVQRANEALQKYCDADPQLHFVATADKYLNNEGLPRVELYNKDLLHLNEAGYKLWASILRTHLESVLKDPLTKNP